MGRLVVPGDREACARGPVVAVREQEPAEGVGEGVAGSTGRRTAGDAGRLASLDAPGDAPRGSVVGGEKPGPLTHPGSVEAGDGLGARGAGDRCCAAPWRARPFPVRTAGDAGRLASLDAPGDAPRGSVVGGEKPGPLTHPGSVEAGDGLGARGAGDRCCAAPWRARPFPVRTAGDAGRLASLDAPGDAPRGSVVGGEKPGPLTHPGSVEAGDGLGARGTGDRCCAAPWRARPFPVRTAGDAGRLASLDAPGDAPRGSVVGGEKPGPLTHPGSVEAGDGLGARGAGDRCCAAPWRARPFPVRTAGDAGRLASLDAPGDAPRGSVVGGEKPGPLTHPGSVEAGDGNAGPPASLADASMRWRPLCVWGRA